VFVTMRWRTTLAVGGAMLVGYAVFMPASASSARYYGVAHLHSNANFHGSHMVIKYSRLTVPDTSTDVAVADSWVINGSGSSYWIEAGMAHGVGGGGCPDEPGSTHFFWADQRPGDGYHCHGGPQASSDTGYTDYIQYAGSGNWNVFVGGFTGTSTDNITGSSVIETGVEVSTNQAQTCVNQNYLEWWDANDDLQVGWHTSSYGDATVIQDKPPYAAWVDRPNHVKDYSNWSC
jgi:hypothetical protein